MSAEQLFLKLLGRLSPRLVARLEKHLKRVPAVRKMIDGETTQVVRELEAALKPYRGEVPALTHLPENGLPREEILAQMTRLAEKERERWDEGYVSGAVYHGGREHVAFLNQVYALHSQSNPLHADLWPSATKYEAEVVAMTAKMLGAQETDVTAHPDEAICGTVTSGGTESILLAMKTYRDWARETRGITRPEMIVPVTAHAAFDKAEQYFGIKKVTIPVDQDYRADVAAAGRAFTRNTIVVVGSAPSFPHGVIDPIAELAELAQAHNVGFHTDACLGGFILPWAEKLGYDVPRFDFRVPGVTSMSADTHKYGYAAKGTSVVLYRGATLRHYQYFTATDWPGGLYFSPTFAGSRPGALSAVCWAALASMGERGYLDATKKILETAQHIRQGIAEIPELKVLGDPLWVIAFSSDVLDIYKVMDFMSKRRWNLNALQKPPALHICVTLRHTQDGVAQKFVSDLKDAVAYVKAHPEDKGEFAPVYGMAANLPLRGVVADLLRSYIDLLYKP